MKTLLDIKKLHVATGGKTIIKDLSLRIRPGELHVLMGPNGSGKSTLAYTLMGHPSYRVRATRLSFSGHDLKKQKPDERARNGLFLAFQYPIVVSGLSLAHLVQSAAAARVKKPKNTKTVHFTLASKLAAEQRTAHEQFDRQSATHRDALHLPEDMLYRSINDGLSGGEKKKSEIFQMLMLQPQLAILDEPDSGLDIDALKIIAQAINRAHQHGMALLLITHYQRILKYLKPDLVHVMAAGKLIRSGDKRLARSIESRGYDWLITETRP